MKARQTEPVEGHYRNTQDLTTTEGEFVEAGSLWSLDDQLLILVDEDRYATYPFVSSSAVENALFTEA